ncbi:MAG: 50S ribosomal protein L24 [Candidatus Altiarchaeota archaeon]|nr:50S ribosomal protein L24 [Candidatus Altiarchaeota archaeon]
MKEPTSSKIRKQRKWTHNAPLHKKKAFCRAMLSPELKKQYSRGSMQVRKGDTVKVMRGDIRGSGGTVLRVDIKNRKIYIDGLTMKKSDGTDVERPFEPSNLQITSIVLEDKERKNLIERKTGG